MFLPRGLAAADDDPAFPSHGDAADEEVALGDNTLLDFPVVSVLEFPVVAVLDFPVVAVLDFPVVAVLDFPVVALLDFPALSNLAEALLGRAVTLTTSLSIIFFLAVFWVWRVNPLLDARL